MKRSPSILQVLFLAILLVAGCRTQAPVTAPATAPDHKELAARIETVMRAAKDTPGREFANRLRSPHYQGWLAFFRGERDQPRHPSLARAIADITHITELTEAGTTWPTPPLCRTPYANSAIRLDGKLDESAWQHAATYTNIYPFNTRKLEGPKTIWKVTWDTNNLYFAFNCEDRDITAKDRARDDDVYNDDCVEAFILPDFRFRTYWEIVISPSGSVFDSVECKKMQKWGLILDRDQDVEGMEFGIDLRGTLNNSDDTDDGYTVELAVPFSQLPGFTRIAPKAGDRLHFMLVRLDRQGEKLHPYAYQPLLGWGHNIWNHAVMELVPNGAD